MKIKVKIRKPIRKHSMIGIKVESLGKTPLLGNENQSEN
jgi:hypothetical protein